MRLTFPSDDSGLLLRPAPLPPPIPAQRRDQTDLLTPMRRRAARRLLSWVVGTALFGAVALAARHELAGGASTAAAAAAEPAPAPAAAPGAADLVRARVALAGSERARAVLEVEQRALAARAAAAGDLERKLADVMGKEGKVRREGNEIHLELVDRILFRLGDAELTPHGERVLARVGAALRAVPDKQVWVQGHTDRTPIRHEEGVVPLFASNWELSAARALTVVHYLQDEGGIDPRRLAAVAFGEHRPVSRRKARNRRIEIVLVEGAVAPR